MPSVPQTTGVCPQLINAVGCLLPETLDDVSEVGALLVGEVADHGTGLAHSIRNKQILYFEPIGAGVFLAKRESDSFGRLTC
jgi:hypothetical protein